MVNSKSLRKNWFYILRRFLLLGFLFTILLPQPASSMPVDRPREQVTPAVSPPAQVYGIAVGAHLRPLKDTYGALLNSYNAAVGKNSAILMYFADWQGFDPYLLDLIRRDATVKPTIMITWQPYNGKANSGCTRDYRPQEFIGYDDILVGRCNTYITNFARSIAARPERFLLRFAHEMNIRDYPYWPGHTGRNASAYVDMYRHVHNVFMAAHKAAGGDNVEWVWSPNYTSNPGDSWNSIHNYYPGDEYVDWIGLSGYNLYPSPGEPNRSFQQIYGDVDGTDAYYGNYAPGVLYDLACHYAKPVILAEFGAGGTDSTAANKVNWINDAYEMIPKYPFVRAVVWFNDFAGENPANVDLRVTNINPPPNLHSSITPAYKTAISPSVYKSSLPSAASVTPPSTYCGNGSPIFSVSPALKLAKRGGSTYFTLKGMVYSTHPTVTFPSTPSGFTAQLVNDQLTPPWGQARIQVSVGSGVPYGSHTIAVNVNGVVHNVRVQVVANLYNTYLPAVRR